MHPLALKKCDRLPIIACLPWLMRNLADMRIVLRQPQTGFYLQHSGEWTNNRETARNFESARAALFWAKSHNLNGGEVLFAFSESKYDFVTSLT